MLSVKRHRHGLCCARSLSLSNSFLQGTEMQQVLPALAAKVASKGKRVENASVLTLFRCASEGIVVVVVLVQRAP